MKDKDKFSAIKFIIDKYRNDFQERYVNEQYTKDNLEKFAEIQGLDISVTFKDRNITIVAKNEGQVIYST